MGRVLQTGASFVPGDAAFRWGLPSVSEPEPDRGGSLELAGVNQNV